MTPCRPARTRPAGVACLLVFLVLAARLVHLQVAEGRVWAARATAIRERSLTVDAPRGRILDRHGRELAGHRPAYRVGLSRSVPEAQRPGLLRRLAPLLARSPAGLARRLEEERRRVAPHRPLPLADDVGEETVLALRERAGDFPGVVIERHPIRHHPHGTLAAHLLGTVGGEGGASGVEAVHDALLAGRPGEERVQVDSRGRETGRRTRRPPVPGTDLRLTVDLDVQVAAEAALAEGMAAARPVHPAPGGAVVALECRSGAVLALASAPGFHPADPPATGDHAPLLNRVVAGLYAPGSVFKPVTALAGLVAGAVTPATVVTDRGAHRVGGRLFRNAQSRAYGPVDLTRALAVSSDVYFYRLGEAIHRPDEKGHLQAAARSLGFGTVTGIDLEGEAEGRVPGPGWKRGAHLRGAVPDPRWYPGDSVNLAIGQGDLLVTPLQLAVAYAGLANDGPRPVPHVTGGAGEPPVGAALAAGHGEAVRAGLRAAVNSPEGTAAAAFAGFPPSRAEVMGKTGTAQRAGHSDTSLFAAVARAGDRCVSVVAVVEEAGFGSVVAAPIVRRVTEALFT